MVDGRVETAAFRGPIRAQRLTGIVIDIGLNGYVVRECWARGVDGNTTRVAKGTDGLHVVIDDILGEAGVEV